MTDLQRQMEQLLLVVSYARRHPGARLDDVAGAVGVDRATLRDELVPLLTLVGKPPFSPSDLVDIWVDGDERLHVDLDQSLGRPLRLTVEESLSLQIALTPLATSGLGAVAARAKALLERLSGLGAPPVEGAAALAIDAHASGAAAAGPQAAILEEGVRARRAVDFTYYTASRDAFGRRRVDPWGLIEVLGAWYLVGRDHQSREERIFKLDRIADAALSDEGFTPPGAFDPATYVAEGRFVGTRGARAVESGGGTARVRVAPPASERVLDEGLRARALADGGGIEVELEFAHPTWAAAWAMALGEAAEVLEPPSVRALVAARAREALALYDGGDEG